MVAIDEPKVNTDSFKISPTYDVRIINTWLGFWNPSRKGAFASLQLVTDSVFQPTVGLLALALFSLLASLSGLGVELGGHKTLLALRVA
jgi:hypothetical protein